MTNTSFPQGHSLGGAYTDLAFAEGLRLASTNEAPWSTFDLRSCITFGQLRVAYVTLADRVFEILQKRTGSSTFRIRNADDPVPTIPPSPVCPPFKTTADYPYIHFDGGGTIGSSAPVPMPSERPDCPVAPESVGQIWDDVKEHL